MIKDESSYLVTKLVAWEREDGQALTELLHQRVKLRVITRGRASERRNILNQDHFT